VPEASTTSLMELVFTTRPSTLMTGAGEPGPCPGGGAASFLLLQENKVRRAIVAMKTVRFFMECENKSYLRIGGSSIEK
jgi:hypothetical protein